MGEGGLTIDDLVIIFSSASKNVSSFLSLISSSKAVAMLVCMSILFFFSSNSGRELKTYTPLDHQKMTIYMNTHKIYTWTYSVIMSSYKSTCTCMSVPSPHAPCSCHMYRHGMTSYSEWELWDSPLLAQCSPPKIQSLTLVIYINHLCVGLP